jgi:hypothetical protein
MSLVKWQQKETKRKFSLVREVITMGQEMKFRSVLEKKSLMFVAWIYLNGERSPP